MNEVSWTNGGEPYSMSQPLVGANGWLFTAYVNEDGTFDLLGHNTDAFDRRDLTRLELAALIAELQPDPDHIGDD